MTPEEETNERMFNDLKAWQDRTKDISTESRGAFLDAWEMGRRFGEERITRKLTEPTPSTSHRSD